MGAPIDIDRLWPSLAAAEKASRHGTELLKELHGLLVRGDTFSMAWWQDRSKILDAIEAHLAAVSEVEAALNTEQRPTHNTQGQPVESPSVKNVDSNEELVA